jgi:hypothetical protein
MPWLAGLGNNELRPHLGDHPTALTLEQKEAGELTIHNAYMLAMATNGGVAKKPVAKNGK